MAEDLRYALRSLAHRPLITSAAVLSLALGIGVNTAMFSVVEPLLLRRLPVPAPEQIVLVTSPGPRPGGSSTNKAGDQAHVFSYLLFRDLEQLEVPGLSRIAAHRDLPANLSYAGRTARVDGLAVSGAYFPVLGVAPALGRLITAEDDRAGGGPPIVVLAHDYWRTQFGADPRVLGDHLRVNGMLMTIVGVAPDGFRGNTSMDAPQVFIPLATLSALGAENLDRRDDHWLYLFARVTPGASREQVEAALSSRFQGIVREIEFPALQDRLTADQREPFLQRRIVLEDGARARDANRAETWLVLGLLLAVTGLVLLIACANVANLLLSRATDRASELSIRVSMGASTWRLARLLLAEAGLLGVAGAAGALVVAILASRGLLTLLPPEDAALLTFELNGPVLLFTSALGLSTALLFSVSPVLYAVRAHASTGLAQVGRMSPSRRAARFRTSLAIAQIALATTLLAHAGLFLTSLVNVARTELGIEREGVMTFRLSPYLSGYSQEQALALFDRVEEELRRAPGVRAVTASTVSILSDSNTTRNVSVAGVGAGPGADTIVSFAQVGLDYFRTLGIPLLGGRGFSVADAANAPRVAIVNEAFVRKFQLDADVIGTRMAIGAGTNRPLDIEIVGPVHDAKYNKVRAPVPPQLFVPYRQGQFGSLTFYVRSAADAPALQTTVREVVSRADANLPIERLRTMEEQIWDNTTTDRVLATVSSWFASLASLLVAVGLYGMLSNSVAQRVREIGIRIAVGARTSQVWRMVLGQVARIAVAGGAVGLVAAVVLGRLAESLLFGVTGTDARILGAAAGLVTLIALSAGALPARRAAHVNPVVALRAE